MLSGSAHHNYYLPAPLGLSVGFQVCRLMRGQHSREKTIISSHAGPAYHVLKKCISPAHHGLPEPVRVLLFQDAGPDRLLDGTGRG
jgi:hypothetical protein